MVADAATPNDGEVENDGAAVGSLVGAVLGAPEQRHKSHVCD